MQQETEFYVGNTIRVRFRIMGLDPVTDEKRPVAGAAPIGVTVKREDGTVLVTLDRAGGGVAELGNGYYAAEFVSDAAGIHAVRISARSPDGRQARERLEVYVQEF